MNLKMITKDDYIHGFLGYPDNPNASSMFVYDSTFSSSHYLDGDRQAWSPDGTPGEMDASTGQRDQRRRLSLHTLLVVDRSI